RLSGRPAEAKDKGRSAALGFLPCCQQETILALDASAPSPLGQIWLGAPCSVVHRRVEDGRGGLGHAATLRFPSPLIKPDVRISPIRLSDWFHRAAHGGGPNSVCVAEAVGDGRRAQQHRS